jgi:hypothetical protein
VEKKYCILIDDELEASYGAVGLTGDTYVGWSAEAELPKYTPNTTPCPCFYPPNNQWYYYESPQRTMATVMHILRHRNATKVHPGPLRIYKITIQPRAVIMINSSIWTLKKKSHL